MSSGWVDWLPTTSRGKFRKGVRTIQCDGDSSGSAVNEALLPYSHRFHAVHSKMNPPNINPGSRSICALCGAGDRGVQLRLHVLHCCLHTLFSISFKVSEQRGARGSLSLSAVMQILLVDNLIVAKAWLRSYAQAWAMQRHSISYTMPCTQ